MAPTGAGKIFFWLIQALPTFWAERIWILGNFIFPIFGIPNCWISRSPDFQNLAWAGPGLGLGWIAAAYQPIRSFACTANSRKQCIKLVTLTQRRHSCLV